MNLSRPVIFAMSTALIFSIGSSSSATTDYSHPSFSVADDRVLNLRETGSKIVMETVEDALRDGGIALLGEDFQIDSSLNWVFGETIEGEADAVVPLWSKGEHVVFTQPGLVVWSGIEEENRIDGNLGVVYRTNLANTIGINAVGGASIFYDHDFQVGLSRISFGADIQRGYLQGSANYYQPLGDAEAGRTGYIEEALGGMDARLVYERRKVRLSGNLGYWQYGEIEGSEGDWELSYGLEAGVRIMEGVFVEAGYQAHDDASIGGRFDLGVAFKFSLPGFEGASYGDGSGSANLYKIVERERRILYEEQKSGGAGGNEILLPTVSFNIADDPALTAGGGSLDITLELSEALSEPVTVNIVASGTAEYGDEGDWDVARRVPVGDEEAPYRLCDTTCPIMFPAGETSADIRLMAQIGTVGETAGVEIQIPTAAQNLVRAGSTPRVEFTIQQPPPPPPPTASLNYSGSTMIAGTGSSVRMRIDLSEKLSEEVSVTLVSDGTATYANDGAGTWKLVYHVLPEGDVPGDTIGERNDCHPEDITMTGCQIVIPSGQTIVDIEVTPELLTSEATIMLTLGIHRAGETGLVLGNSWRRNLTIQ